MKFGILLSGCGVYDGAEIQEAVLSMLAVKEAGHDYQCISVNKNQHHVVNHNTGEEMKESRNMMVEAARIARGDVMDISLIKPDDLDALIIPGGFGSAKNFSKWAFSGPAGEILPEIKLLIVNLVNIGRPICALCVSPVLIAKSFEGSDIHPTLTLGTSVDSSPYIITDFHTGVKSTGSTYEEKSISEISIDSENKIVCAPCYMMDTNIVGIRNNIRQAVEATIALCR